MGSAYAGVLGFLAFFVTIARGAIEGQGLAVTPQACVALAVFSAAGLIAGKVADSAVETSVAENLRAEIAAHQQQATSSREA